MVRKEGGGGGSILGYATHLDGVLLGGQRVDDADVPGFGGQVAHLVFSIFPPRLAKVIGPVRARQRRWNVHKTTLRGVILEAACFGVDMRLDLKGSKTGKPSGGKPRFPFPRKPEMAQFTMGDKLNTT